MRQVLTVIITAGLLIALPSCSSSNGVDPKPPKTYKVADTQLPPAPTYNRLKWAHLPEMYPALLPPLKTNRPRLFPVYHFTIKNKPLCEAAVLLAGTSRYSSYCSTLLKKEHITLTALGTVDELAEMVEARSSARVVVDHENREIRFLLNTEVQERFFGMEETSHEY